ncbi:hypothetical protein GCM10010411_69300 [Actinomadura fulvescens]|uniref:Uncharacterized protein n=1 Tax=Actinomadura fulvescens TaxID=46160 RepID=A0ABN3QD32_9ACTN
MGTREHGDRVELDGTEVLQQGRDSPAAASGGAQQALRAQLEAADFVGGQFNVAHAAIVRHDTDKTPSAVAVAVAPVAVARVR